MEVDPKNMINLKDWKKFKDQTARKSLFIAIYFTPLWMRESKKHSEKVKRYFEECGKKEIFPIMPPIQSKAELELLAQRDAMHPKTTVEDCLNWIAAGRPSMVRKLHVKEV